MSAFDTKREYILSSGENMIAIGGGGIPVARVSDLIGMYLTLPKAGHLTPVGGWAQGSHTPPTHPPTGKHPNFPAVITTVCRYHQQTPSSLPPHSMFMTTVTAMCGGGCGRRECRTYIDHF